MILLTPTAPVDPSHQKLDSVGHLVEYNIMAAGITPYPFGVSSHLNHIFLGLQKLCL